MSDRATNTRKRPAQVPVLTITPTGEITEGTSGPPVIGAFGGGLEGAARTTRETARWAPSRGSPDQIVNIAKAEADARGRDSILNDGYGLNAVSTHRDSIVGSQYRLTSNPDAVFMAAPDGWSEEFQKIVESRFTLAAESNDSWLDAQRMNTFTGQVRLAVAGFVMTGEVLASVEWIREAARPFKTAIQMIATDRLCNPQGLPDTLDMRRGIMRDSRGKPLTYSIRQGYQTDPYNGLNAWTWNTVPARTPWGRKQIIHIIEQLMPNQSRGVADMVSVLEQMRMTKGFQRVTLQNAVVNASYAAAIESELPGELLQTMMGGGQTVSDTNPYMVAIGDYLNGLGEYISEANGIKLDGVMIPHLFPGTKLNMKPMGTPGGVGTDFEASLLRHVAAGLGLSYEELAKDYSKVSYSSAKTSVAATGRFMSARKKMVADRFANDVFALWLEEDWNAGNLPYPPGKDASYFYEPLAKEALTRCSWIGSGAGQIDELKETQAAILRVGAGLSTYEQECAKLGSDWREIFTQQAREVGLIDKLGLTFSQVAKRPLGVGDTVGVTPGAAAVPPEPPAPPGGKGKKTK